MHVDDTKATALDAAIQVTDIVHWYKWSRDL